VVVLTVILAHVGQPPQPHDLWSTWNLEPALVGGIVLVLWLHHRGRARGGRRPVDGRRARCFVVGLLVIAVATISPLEPLTGALASAHMVQHVLLVLVAAPLLAFSAPGSTLLRGSPPSVRRASGRWRRRLGPGSSRLRVPHHPATVWLLHVGTLWIWHSAVFYDAALTSGPLHVLEHATFLLTGVLFWRVVVGARGAGRVPGGLGVLLVFGMAMQSVLLSLLLTFAREPWYEGYTETTTAWGLAPLADQQLAGVIMWVPAGLVYVVTALALLGAWLRTSEREPVR
jgi:putative membrane protein